MIRHRTLRWIVGAFTLMVLLSMGCTPAPVSGTSAVPTSANTVKLFDAAQVIQDQWHHLVFRGTTDYSLVAMDGQIAIQATANGSASALIRSVVVDSVQCPEVEWSWMVTEIQPDADIRVKQKEDVAASLFLLFGDPGFLFEANRVPTLRYVWTNDRVQPESVIDNPYLPGIVRSIVVRCGDQEAGRWMTERRDVVADYQRAFGRSPESPIQAVAIFTDNDQTQQAATAYYGWARMYCRS